MQSSHDLDRNNVRGLGMKGKIVIAVVFFLAFVFFIIGDSNNEPLETQNNAATMCMACIGLE